MKYFIFLGLVLGIQLSNYAQTELLNENFSNGIPSTWTIADEDGLTVHTSVSFVDSAWAGFENSFDTCAVSTSYYIDSNQTLLSKDYLITPELGLLSFGNLLSWSSKSFDANYTETYYVLLSATTNSVSSFTDTLLTVTNDSPNWKSFSINLFTKGYANQNIYIAFRNASTNKFLLGIDNVRLTANDPAGISNQSKIKLSVFPNPVKEKLTIHSNKPVSYTVSNINGKMILKGKSKLVDCSQLTTGIYFIKIKYEGKIITKKIIKL